ncbi:hypothetical protein IFM89_033066 [Coptis chinensis]|uniref:Sacsin n=1 Tax=Coptis chinensis TaxID=261450 RepID=A0A835IFS3_9MAGN|nr:hypothetical protein IFM89_033066 [Coptis chinensis]
MLFLGIGFKSVFLITAQPFIFSNGYQIKFNEDPCPDCNLGYIVPEWVDENPTLADIQKIYGRDALPATTIILPLKPEKERVVKIKLSKIHPEVLLFLSKIRRLSVREDNEESKLNTVSAISISSETDLVTRKNVGAESYTLFLSAEEDSEDNERECRYYMWRQKFPVNQGNMVERRNGIDELVITLAFPYGKRLNRGMDSPGIYAFLPTEMVTNFPFIIQADFVLASSRETILQDNKWNQGILDSIPLAFVNAFISLLKTSEGAPNSSLLRIFEFLPVDSSSYGNLNIVRDTIREKLLTENIMLSESCTEQKFFYKPCDVGRIMPPFWNILIKARDQGVSLHNLSFHGICALSSAFDKEYYDDVLNFLEVKFMDAEWYAKCIRSSNLVLGLSEDVYLELLFFVADKWTSHFQHTNMKNIPLLKYVGQDGHVYLCSINEVAEWVGKRICLSYDARHISWLIDWNKEFRAIACFFMPKSTQEAMRSFRSAVTLTKWLSEHVEASFIEVNDYADLLLNSLKNDRRLVVAFAHFLRHSLVNKYVSQEEAESLCDKMPLLDNYGCVSTERSGVLVPAKGSKWVGLIGSNPWRRKNYVELGEDYLHAGNFAGVHSPERRLVMFLKKYVGASDIPDLCPPDDAFPTVSSPLTKENTFLLLEWIRNLKRKRSLVDGIFLRCIRDGSWLSTSVGYRPPSQSFLLTPEWGNLLKNGSELVDIPLINQQFYDNRIIEYKEELISIGVMSEFGEACRFIGRHLMHLASNNNLTRANVFSILNFIKFLREKYLPPDDFVKSVRVGSWLRTKHGERSPVGSILYDSKWNAASKICNLPFVDQQYYGERILTFRTELQLLGVVVGFDKDYQRLTECFRMPTSFTSMTVDEVLLILDCLRHSRSSDQLVSVLKSRKWIRTTVGYKFPSECFLFDSEWGCLLEIFGGFPLICEKDLMKSRHQIPIELHNCICDERWLRTRLGQKSPKESILFSSDWEYLSPIALLPFIVDSENCYGTAIREYKEELKAMGVVLEFNKGSKFVADGLTIPHNPTDINPSSVLSLLECVHIMLKVKNDPPLPKEFMRRINKKWLKTHMGYRPPNECLLFGSDWNSILQLEDGAFIDEKFYGFDLASYKKELNSIGVTVDVKNGCRLLASELESHSHFAVIARIYAYLQKYDWKLDKPDDRTANWIWIPDGSDKGQWVSPEECVLHDKDGLFGSQLNVLERHYDKKLWYFFSLTLHVRQNPSVDDYCRLWKTWESSECQLTHAECCAFWVCIVQHWNSSKTKNLLAEMVKLPAYTNSDVIQLCNKQDIFIPDDLLLMDLLQNASPDPLFVWYPQPSLPSIPRTKLHEIYSSIGVRVVSESVEKSECSKVDGDFEQVNPSEILIRRELIRLILGFLADPSIEVDANKRQKIVQALLDVNVFETEKPITVGYSLSLSSGESVNVKASQMIRWERESSKVFTQKINRSCGHKANIEFATFFSQVIADGILWEKSERIPELCELIKLGWLLEFEEEAIGFLLKTKNLQLFMEDLEFLNSKFPSE